MKPKERISWPRMGWLDRGYHGTIRQDARFGPSRWFWLVEKEHGWGEDRKIYIASGWAMSKGRALRKMQRATTEHRLYFRY